MGQTKQDPSPGLRSWDIGRRYLGGQAQLGCGSRRLTQQHGLERVSVGETRENNLQPLITFYTPEVSTCFILLS